MLYNPFYPNVFCVVSDNCFCESIPKSLIPLNEQQITMNVVFSAPEECS